MSLVFRGLIQPQLQKRTIIYSPTSGYIRTWDYKGFSEELMLNLMNQYSNVGCEATFGGEHGTYSLQVRDATGEITLDTWQIQQSDERPSSLENPRHIGNCTEDERFVVKWALDHSTTLEGALAEMKQQGATGFVLPGEYATRLWKRMRDGGTEFVRSIYILRHTTNANSGYYSNVADWNIDQIYTTTGLLNECEDSYYWRLPLPPRLAYKIQSLEFPPVRSGYQNGWLKRGSSETTAANFRIEISTEYWMGQISTDEYAMA